MLTDNRLKLLILALSLTSYSGAGHAEIDWVSATLDNDLFVGNDSGYSNGLFLSFYDVGSTSEELPSSDFWVSPLMWSMTDKQSSGAVNAYMFGQSMNTPSDISIVNPDQNELPYSALLAFTNSYLKITPNFADRASTTIGVVGPIALGEDAQKLVHKMTGSDEPKGWDTQLENELVFQFSRGRTWRNWESASANFDLLTNVDASIGTISSTLGAGLTLRYGRNLLSSYATTLFNNSRTTNPTAVNGGWYFYLGAQTGYFFNQIFTDGNTFEDSRSIDYDHEYISLSAGFAYSWPNSSITFAVNDSNLLQTGDTEDALEDLTQFGTITFAWRL
ncbi:lipid A deacylase LpxR family protein [Halioxenophilus aromaticivorans]|uniref:Lipid A deacylase LpxR family protein n=1 Tax=Halioxenophilus aromaticivorans TaxID=1306992 RepID=A0AAV3U3K4_9ALTE